MRQPFLLCCAVIVGALLVMWWADAPDFLRGRGHQAERSHPDGQSTATSEQQEHRNRFTVKRTERDSAWTRPESWFPTDEPRAMITFGRLMSDAEVLAWLEAHDVEPRAFYMHTPGGFNGTYRLMEDQERSFEEIIVTAREQAIDNFANSLESQPLRFQQFAEQYTEGEVSTDANLEKAARSLLTLRSALEDAHAHAVRGDPLIHALEAAGDDAQFVPQEGGPTDFDVAVSDTDSDTRTRVPTPFGEEPAYTDPLVDAMDSAEVYEAIAQAGEDAPDVPIGAEGALQIIR
jgi:hypothetical protein